MKVLSFPYRMSNTIMRAGDPPNLRAMLMWDPKDCRFDGLCLSSQHAIFPILLPVNDLWPL